MVPVVIVRVVRACGNSVESPGRFGKLCTTCQMPSGGGEQPDASTFLDFCARSLPASAAVIQRNTNAAVKPATWLCNGHTGRTWRTSNKRRHGQTVCRKKLGKAVLESTKELNLIAAILMNIPTLLKINIWYGFVLPRRCHIRGRSNGGSHVRILRRKLRYR